MSARVLVTGGAGFIGSHLVDSLLADGTRITVVDDFNDSYSPLVKRANVARHFDYPGYTLIEADIRAPHDWTSRARGDFDAIVHLAARAGVRASINEPALYEDVNVRGTERLLEFARSRSVRQFVFASSSSVYGVNPNTPWRESDVDLQPISPYATTKAAAERLGRAASADSDMRFVALRFFTVYGPRQRPDLAIHTFARKILSGQAIPIFGDGSTMRDYTYIDDIVSGIRAALTYRASATDTFNLGNDRPVSLLHLVRALESVLGRRAKLKYEPLPAGDVPSTWAAIDHARQALGYQPCTTLEEGLDRFMKWFAVRPGLRIAPAAPQRSPWDGTYPVITGAIAKAK
jgi:UDP-glucuronate 4-epimerase